MSKLTNESNERMHIAVLSEVDIRELSKNESIAFVLQGVEPGATLSIISLKTIPQNERSLDAIIETEDGKSLPCTNIPASSVKYLLPEAYI
jgi:hypothetical protein